MRTDFVTRQKGKSMNDLIYRQHAINALENTDCELSNDAWNELTNAIRHVPSAEPKKGRWVDIVEMDSGGYPFKVGVCCSVCGFETLSEDFYCSHCGAKMEMTE